MLFFFLYLYWQMETTTFFFLWNYLCLCRINGREETRSPSVYEWVSAIRFGFTWCFEQIVKFNLKNTQAYTHSSMSKSTLRKFLWLFLNTVDKVLKVDIFSFICVSLSLSLTRSHRMCVCAMSNLAHFLYAVWRGWDGGGGAEFTFWCNACTGAHKSKRSESRWNNRRQESFCHGKIAERNVYIVRERKRGRERHSLISI